MGRRLDLHTKLEALCPHVYFQTPPAMAMEYPAIVYKRDYDDAKFANNGVYSRTKRYQVTVIDRDPDSVIPDQVAVMPLCRFNRAFAADGLNHDVFELYF